MGKCEHQACSIIIIAYNSNGTLPSCLHSVFNALKGIEHQVIVVDNGSPHPLSPSLKEEYPDTLWIDSPKNLGFGKACNLAAKQAKHSLLFFVNPDTLISPDTFASLTDYILQKPDVGIVGCRVLNGDGSLQWACRRSFPSPMIAVYKTLGLSNLFPRSRKFGAYNLTYLSPENEAEVDAVSGSFFCVRKEVYEKVSGFDEGFFLYGEDLDICYRVKKLGLHNYYFPGTSIIHFKGHSSRSRVVRSFIDFYQAMIIFARKHAEFRPVPLWMISAGVLMAAGLGVFSRLLPQWWKLGLDLCIGLLFFKGVQASPDVMLMGLGTLFPLFFRGEYGVPGFDGKRLWHWTIPTLIVFLSGLAYWNGLGLRPLIFLTIYWSLLWLWRRFWFWGRYFEGVFNGRRKRTLILGGHAQVRNWFIRENLLPDRDILGSVSAQDIDELEVREHSLGHINSLPAIQARTGIREILVVPDARGHHELPPFDLLQRCHIKPYLAIGHPDHDTFTLVDLYFLK